MKNVLLLILCLSSSVLFAQKKKKQDVEAIKSMCGCYEVAFNFAETFSPKKDYKFHDNYRSSALEYVLPVEETKGKIILQHLLVIGDTMIIKHWRQDWIYENKDLYVYDKDNSWVYKELDANDIKGQWTQKVYQVDDGLRYEGSATWVHVDGKHFWESVADAPLPRREFSKRSDYNVTKRKNRHEITDYGWVHEQDNQKITRGTEDEWLANEKGWNTYTKVADEKCAVAKAWWSDNQRYWADVRSVWDEFFATKARLSFNMKVDDKILFQRLFALGDEVDTANYDSEAVKTEVRGIIKKHLKTDVKLAVSK
ncbi:MAG: DUF6607 family protein [Bacteroidota bacterium]